MSLLSNLLAFSCLNDSTEKEQRSASASSRFLFESQTPRVKDNINQKTSRTESKSLSKLDLLSNKSQNIDPKHRSLHRLAHKLGMKVRKHYYTVFVLLQSLKKNGIDLSVCHSLQKYSQKKVELAIDKIEQTERIVLTKQFQQKWKSQCFENIKQHAKLTYIGKRFDRIFTKIDQRIYFKRLTDFLKKLEGMSMKLDIFVDTCSNYLNGPVSAMHVQSAFQQIKLSCLHVEKHKPHQNTPQRISLGNEDHFDNLTVISEENTNFSHISKSVSNSPLKSSSILKPLRQAVHIQTIDQQYHDISKSYQTLTMLNEKPICLEDQIQSVPIILKKLLPQALESQEIGDLEDISGIFREYSNSKIDERYKTDKSSIVSGIDHNIEDVVGQSFLRIENMISDMQKYRTVKDKIVKEDLSPNFSVSGIDMIQINEMSLNGINKSKLNQSFGSDAVSFKNSLVMERESMHKTDRNKANFLKKNSLFSKKKPERFENQVERILRSSSKRSVRQKNHPTESNYLIQQNQQVSADSWNLAHPNTFAQKQSFNQQPMPDPRQYKTLYNSEEKTKSLSFQHRNSLALRKTKLQEPNVKRQFDQRSDEGIRYLVSNQKLFQPFNDHNFLIYNKDGMDWNRKDDAKDMLPVRDTNYNQRMSPMLTSTVNQQKQAAEFQSNIHPSKRKEQLATPKKFINLMRKTDR